MYKFGVSVLISTLGGNHEYLDAQWFQMLMDIKRPLLLSSFSYNLNEVAQEKELFFNSNNYNPKFRYTNKNLLALSNAAIVKLSDLRCKVLQEEGVLSIRDAYVQKIDEAMLEQKIISASSQFDWAAFNKYNVEKYGVVSISLIANRLKNLQKKFSVLKNVEIFESRASTNIQTDILDCATGYFESWPSLILDQKIDQTKFLNAYDVAILWGERLRSMTDTRWSVKVSKNVLYIKVNAKTLEVLIPINFIASEIKVRALFAHEIGTHVFRLENGKKSKLKLLSIGLAGYSAAEEGLALMREQVILRRTKLPSFDKYLALAYATGAIDGVAKDFRSVYVFLNEIFSKRLSITCNSEDSSRIARTRAWNLALRIFRGGNPAIPGCCLLRDKIYREGAYTMWNLFTVNYESFFYAKFGKFDPSNSKHLDLVKEYFTL
jgi:hypothetical protein